MGRKRARTDTEKADKRKHILDAAWKLFTESDGQLPKTMDIAREAKIAKGTVYVYFRTKEEIFLELLPEILGEWAVDAYKGMDRVDNDDMLAVAKAITRFPIKNPLLMELAGILRGVLEKNAPDEAIIAMKVGGAELTLEMGAQLSRRLTWLSPEDGASLLISVYALLIGFWQHASLPERLRKKIVDSIPGFFEMDLHQTVARNVADLLEGMRLRGRK
jgi:TetR/AcrR family transcriptional regulator